VAGNAEEEDSVWEGAENAEEEDWALAEVAILGEVWQADWVAVDNRLRLSWSRCQNKRTQLACWTTAGAQR
jgi:hypothetical protein